MAEIYLDSRSTVIISHRTDSGAEMEQLTEYGRSEGYQSQMEDLGSKSQFQSSQVTISEIRGVQLTVVEHVRWLSLRELYRRAESIDLIPERQNAFLLLWEIHEPLKFVSRVFDQSKGRCCGPALVRS
jgi:hypothetical protein